MRKVVLSLSLCLLLLFGQAGALVHELSHVKAVTHQDIHVDQGQAAPTDCPLCLAYSQLSTPASHLPHMVRFDPTSCAAGSTRCPANIPNEVPTARSRGPPVQLIS